MKVFVTGGAGFIGSVLVDELFERWRNVEITVYDNLSSGKIKFIEHHMKRDDFKFVEGDLNDVVLLNKSIKGHEFVFHMAANPDIRLGTAHTDVDFKNGTLGTYNLLEAMRINDIKKIAFASSSVVYGEPKIIPTPEDYGPLIPISLYGASKLAAEAFISSYCHLFDMQSWIYRFANVIGKRGTHGVIVDFINKLRKNPKNLEILGDGTQKKAYLLVEDCVDAILYVIEHADDDVNIFNLGYETQVNVTRIAEIVVEEMGLTDVEFCYTGGPRGWKGDVRVMLLSIEKIKKLGWRPKMNSELAVRKSARILIKDLGIR